MDENEYRSTYHSINSNRCAFEKLILTGNCQCQHHERFNLAEREGVKCLAPEAQQLCAGFLNEVRQQARFALGLTHIVGNLLPHSKEIQVQKGALLGLRPDLPNLPDTPIEDISQHLQQALTDSGGTLQEFPIHNLIPSIKHHPPRPRRSRRRK